MKKLSFAILLLFFSCTQPNDTISDPNNPNFKATFLGTTGTNNVWKFSIDSVDYIYVKGPTGCAIARHSK